MSAKRPLSRAEAKAVTRARMLEAAGRLLKEHGYGGLSASAVSRAAGVAQPTFYVHFRDKDDLLRAFSEAQLAPLRARLRQARERVMAGQGVDAVRETFRIPLQAWMENPELLRLAMQERHHAGSPPASAASSRPQASRRDAAPASPGAAIPGSPSTPAAGCGRSRGPRPRPAPPAPARAPAVGAPAAAPAAPR